MLVSIKRVFVALAALVIAVAASAQVTTSAISGTVSDKDGAIAGVPVVALHVPSGTTYYSVTDAKGNYRINNITAGGPYTVTVEMLGYRKVEYTEIYAELAQTMTLTTVLEEESLTLDAAVFVADGKNSNMNVHRSGIGTSISNKRMESIPSVGRSMNDIMKLTPQAATTGNGFAVGGGTYRGSSVTVDGAAFNNAFGIGSNLPAGGTPISLDAIEQMSINITPFDVRQSGFTGGAINAVTKSGSNEVHASVYNYFTNQDFQGYKVADKELTKSESLNNTVGVTVGGPIIKNKLFFFVNGEYTVDTVPGASFVARADESIKFDATNHRPTVAQMDDIKSFLDSKFGYNPGRYQGYSLETPDYKVLARLDWNINADNKLNVRFSHTHNYYSSAPSTSMSPLGGNDSQFGSIKFNRNTAGRQSKYAMYFEGARYFQEQNFTSVAAELNSRLFDGKANNMFRFAWSHQDEPRSHVGDVFPTVDIMSTAGVTGDDTSAIFATFGMDPFTYGNLRDVQTVTVTDEFSYATGIHNIIAGAQFEWNRAINGFMQGGAGWYLYDSWDSFKQDVLNPSVSTGPTAFMITHANLQDPTSQAFPAFDYTQASVYAQDEMNISDNFKLTAGLRLEMPIISIPTDNNNKEFESLGVKNPSSSFHGLTTNDVPATTLSVSPRVGFNWDVLGNRNLVVRGGTGIYTGRIPNVWLVSAIGNANVLQYQYINKSVNNAAGENIHFHSNRNDVINMLYQNSAFKVQDLAAPTSTTVIAKDLKMPSSWKTSLSVDAKLPFGINASLEGIYSQNYNEVYATILGYAKNGTQTLPGQPARELWTKEGIKNSANKDVNGYYIHNVNDKGLNGNYYSLTAQLSKDFNFGLSTMVAYTHSSSKVLSDGNGDQVSEFANINTVGGCNAPELGYAGYVAPNRLIASVGYTINEGSRMATKLGVFYEGYNLGYIGDFSYTRYSFLTSGYSGASSAARLLYIPTDAEIDQMQFGTLAKVKDASGNVVLDSKKAEVTEWVADDGEMAKAYKEFLASNSYTKNHRGEFSTRNVLTAPWVNRFNVRVAQDFYFNVAGKKHTLELSMDVNNVGNLMNSNWGTFKQINSNVILSYQKNNALVDATETSRYTFNAPVWNNYNKVASTWSALFSAKYSF